MTKIVFFVIFAKKLKNLMALWRFKKTMLDLAKILQESFQVKMQLSRTIMILFSLKKIFFSSCSTRH